jgi:hypothetical protein
MHMMYDTTHASRYTTCTSTLIKYSVLMNFIFMLLSLAEGEVDCVMAKHLGELIAYM